MWETNSANDCMRLHKIENHLIYHNTALLSTLHVAFLHITYMFILLKYRDFHRLTTVRRFVDGRWQIALRPSTNRFTTVKHYTTSRQNKRNTKLLLKKCHACINQATYFQDMNNVSAQY